MKYRIRFFLKKFPIADFIFRRFYLYIKYLINADLSFAKDVSNKAIISKIILLKPDREIFFGYYDKSPWSTQGKFYLIHQRLEDGSIGLLCIDIEAERRKMIGKTVTWNYQQGAMLQWVPGSVSRRVIFNSANGNLLGSYIYDIDSGEKQFIKYPIQAMHQSGRKALSINYCRLRIVNNEYGYENNFKNFYHNLADDEDGLWEYSLGGESSTLLITISELIKYKYRSSMKNALHCINHVMYSPTGDKFIFIHRWVTSDHKRYSRLFQYVPSKEELKLLLDDDFVSHYCWLDDETIFTYSGTKEFGEQYYYINSENGEVIPHLNSDINSFGDGHPGISPDKEWIITDTYPDDARIRTLLLLNRNDGQVYQVGRFYSPVSFEDEKRCDLHPRWHPSEPKVSIDSAHSDVRRNYIINVEGLTGPFKK